MLLFFTCLADAFTTAVLWFNAIGNHIKDFWDNEIWDNKFAEEFLLQYSFFLSLLTLLLCAIDRFCAVSAPLWHATKVTWRPTAYVFFSLWVISIIPIFIRLGILQFQRENLDNDNDNDTTFNHVFHCILLLLIVVIISLFLITYAKCRSAVNGRNFPANSSSSTRNREIHTARQNRRLIILFISMALIFAITFIPKAVIHTLLCAGAAESIMDTENEHILVITFKLLYFVSTIANPVLTLVVNKDYLRTICVCKHRHLKRGTSSVVSRQTNNTFQSTEM